MVALQSGAGAAGVAGAVLALGLIGAVFSSTSQSPGNVYTADSLNAYVPTAATASRTASTTCLVSWAPVASPPSGMTFDVTDGSGTTVATGVSGTSTSITVPTTAVTPTVRARLGAWVSSSSRATTAACNGFPDAPGSLTLTPSDGAVAASWTAPVANGGTLASYTATISPAPGNGSATCTTTVPATSCSWSGLSNGLGYAVSVTATSDVGAGPSASSTAVPYPSTVMSASALKLWLDGADPAALYSDTGCSSPATGAGQSVACWKDRSGQGNDVTQSTSTQRPTSSTVSGQIVPTFDGSNDWLNRSTSTLPTGTTSSVTFVAARYGAANPASAGAQQVVFTGTTSTAQGRYLYKLPFAGRVGTNANFATDATDSPIGSSTPFVIAADHTGGTDYGIRLNARSRVSASAAFNVTGTAIQLSHSTQPWNGAIMETILVQGGLTGAQTRQVEEYLARKWSSTITPGQPTAIAATAGDAQTTVSWTAPTYDGGSAITSYTVTAAPTDSALSTVTLSCAVSPCTLTGLTNGVPYTVTVVANNALGAGPASTSATVVPRPALLANAGLWLDGVDPDGDGIVEGAGESCDTSTSCASTSNVLKRWVDKTRGGRDAVQSTTAMAGTWTPATGLVTFAGNGYYQTAAGVPASPDVTAFTVASSSTSPFTTAGWLIGGRAANGWMLHPDQGSTGARLFGMTSSGYNVQTTNTALAIPSTSITNPHVWDGQISGGTASQTLDAAVDGVPTTTASSATTRAATNVVLTIGADDLDLAAHRGNGTFREVLVFNTALTAAQRRTIREYLARKWGAAIVPDAPTSVLVAGGTNTVTVTWTAPTWNGGSAVTGYTVTASSGATCTSATTTCTFSGLAPGTYTFTVTATNSAGTGPASPTSASTQVTATLYVWGDGSSARSGVLMQNSTTTTAVRMPGPEPWSLAAQGDNHACGITTTGALSCWGANSFGSLGVGDSTQRWEPATVSGGGSWLSVDAGEDTTCGLKSDQSLWCWGFNGNGEVGDNTTTDRNIPTAASTAGVLTWSQVSVGKDHACGLKTDSTLWCWGSGANGRLGNGATTAQNRPVQVSSGTTFTAVSAGWTSTCAIRASDSAILCWGAGANGALGNGGTADSSTPVVVSGGLTWSRVTVANSYACGITNGAALYCWGANLFGQLGDGTTTDRTTPVREKTSSSSWSTSVLGGTSAYGLPLMAWNSHTCALRTSGTLYCWGYNPFGQLGDGTTTNRTSPTQAGTAAAWTSVTGSADGTCGLRSDAAVWCTGNDGAGQLGQFYGNAAGAPTPVNPPSDAFTAASAGWLEGCGVRSDGTLWCWGNNANGVVGDGTLTPRWSPIQVGAASTWRSVSVGTYSVCAIRSDDSLWCWGYASYGQTGVSGAAGNVTSPTAGPTEAWSSVSSGETHTCGLKTDGTLWCWGENSRGSVGDGSLTTRTTPVQLTVTGVTTWTTVRAGYYGTCAIAATGTAAGGLFCWGYNTSGQVGDGTTTDRTAPTRIGSATWTGVIVGRGHACGVQTDGTLWCWGYNGSGQVGDGTTTNRTAPTQVGTATTWAQAAAAYDFSCARRTDRTLWCWGSNAFRQLGNRSTTNLTTPTQVPGVTTSHLEDAHTSSRTMVAIS